MPFGSGDIRWQDKVKKKKERIRDLLKGQSTWEKIGEVEILHIKCRAKKRPCEGREKR
jgi:hypothetical protein